MSFYYNRPSKSVSRLAEDSAQAASQLQRLKARPLTPAPPTGQGWGKTEAGKRWLRYIESFCHDDNRASRGRTYARHGAVIDVEFVGNVVHAYVVGSSTYNVQLDFGEVPQRALERFIEQLTQAQAAQRSPSPEVMALALREAPDGLLPKTLKSRCACFDWSDMCKHRIAVLYGLGGLIDQAPSTLFSILGLSYSEITSRAFEQALAIEPDWKKSAYRRLEDEALGELFGVELLGQPAPQETLTAATPQTDESLSVESLLVIGFLIKHGALLVHELEQVSGLSAQALKPAIERLSALKLIRHQASKGYTLTPLAHQELRQFL